MSTDSLLDLWRGALTVTVVVSAPFMIAGLAVGLVVAIMQTATQLQESILTFVPKLAAALVVLALGGHWILDKLGKYTTEAFTAQTEKRSDLVDLDSTTPIPPIAPSMTLTEPEVGAIIAALSRVGGLVATAPVIGEQGVPSRAKLVFALTVSIAVGLNRPGVPLGELPMTAALELAVGLLTGLTARFAMARIAVAGQLMGLSLGLGFAAQYDMHAGESAGVLRSMLTTLTSFAFLAAGGLEAIVRSSAASPAEISQLAMLGPMLIHHATSAFAHGLSLAAPIMIAALAGNVALAVMNRAAPAINVFSIALSAVLVLGGVVLLATAAHLVAGMTDAARAAVDVLAT